jgi:hypothetical protein
MKWRRLFLTEYSNPLLRDPYSIWFSIAMALMTMTMTMVTNNNTKVILTVITARTLTVEIP